MRTPVTLKRKLLLPLISGILLGPVLASAQTTLEIIRKPLSGWATFIYDKDKTMRIDGGVLTEAIRMTSSSLSSKSVGYKELPNNMEILVLVSRNGTRCYLPADILSNYGFESVEDFRVYLANSDAVKVTCLVDIDAALNVARSLVLHYNFDFGARDTKPSPSVRVSP